MANLKQTTMCCCLLPRAGIMLFTFLYAGYAFSGMFFMSLGHVLTQKFGPASVKEQDEMTLEFSRLLFTWEHMADALCGFIYFYAFILAYQRKWKSFEHVLYALTVIVLYGVYSMYSAIKFIFEMIFISDSPQPDHLDVDELASMKKSIILFSVAIALVAHVIPWLVQVYLIKQTRSYIKYVLYKKDAKAISPS